METGSRHEITMILQVEVYSIYIRKLNGYPHDINVLSCRRGLFYVIKCLNV